MRCKPDEYLAMEGGCKMKMTRFIKWLAINGAMVWCAWTAVGGSEGPGRVLAFVAWFHAAIYWLSALATHEATAKAVAKGRSVPAWLSHGYNISMAIFLVWHGWWWTAIAFVLLTIAESAIYHNPKLEIAKRK